MFPAPILASPLNHATQSISGSLSLGSYMLYAGKVGVNVTTPSYAVDVSGAINSMVGFLYNGLAPNGHCLVGNGSYYVDSSKIAFRL